MGTAFVANICITVTQRNQSLSLRESVAYVANDKRRRGQNSLAPIRTVGDACAYKRLMMAIGIY